MIFKKVDKLKQIKNIKTLYYQSYNKQNRKINHRLRENIFKAYRMNIQDTFRTFPNQNKKGKTMQEKNGQRIRRGDL